MREDGGNQEGVNEMGNEAYELARAQMIGAINASSGPEQRMYQQNLAILENIGQAWNAVEGLSKMVDKDRKIIHQIFEMCQLLKEENDALKARIVALEQKPVKKWPFG